MGCNITVPTYRPHAKPRKTRAYRYRDAAASVLLYAAVACTAQYLYYLLLVRQAGRPPRLRAYRQVLGTCCYLDQLPLRTHGRAVCIRMVLAAVVFSCAGPRWSAGGHHCLPLFATHMRLGQLVVPKEMLGNSPNDNAIFGNAMTAVPLPAGDFAST